jgi:WD40 repeat protein
MTLPDEVDLTALASDGVRLMQQFSMVIMQNPLHIYASVLLFAPTESPLRKAYLPSFPSLPRIVTGLDSHWSSVISTINIGNGRSCQSIDSIPEDSVRSITFSSDGSCIVIGSDDSVVRLWDHKSGTYIELGQHSSVVTCVAFSPDESMIASSSVDGSVRVWDAKAETMTLKYEFQIDNIEHVDSSVVFRPALTSVIFSPDSHFIASGSSTGAIHIWDLSIEPSLEWELLGHTSWICSLVFLPGGSQMASCSVDGMVCIWDASTWGFIRQPLDRHLYGVNSITFSPCGSRIAICFVDGSLKLESVGSCGDEQPEILSPFLSIKISPDCSHSVAYSSNCPPCLSSGSGAPIPITGAETPVSFTFTTFSPTSHHVACRCGDGTIRLYDISANPSSFRVVCTDMGNTGPMAFTDNGLEIGFYASDGSIHTWNIGGETMRSVPGDSAECPLMISFSPDNVYIAVLYTDGYLDIWNINDGTVTQFQHEGKWVNIVAFSPDQPLIAIGLSTGDVFVYNYIEDRSVFHDTDFKQPIVELHFMAGQLGWTLLKKATIGGLCSTQNVTSTSDTSSSLVCFGYSFQGTVCAAFSADGSKVASSSATAQVTVWDSLTGVPTVRFISQERQAMGAIAFSLDLCQIAAGSHQGIVRIWKLDGQQRVNSDAEDFDHIVSSATVSSNGQRIAVLRGSQTLLLIDPSNINRAVSTLPLIDRCQFSPDGKLLVSCSLDGYLHVQETDSGHLISRSLVNGALKLLLQEFSPDSRYIVTVNEAYDIQLWHADTEFREGRNLGRASSSFGGRGEISRLKFTSDSSRILEYEYDSPSFGLRVLELDGTVRYQGSNSCPSPDGLRIVQLPPLPVGVSHRLVTYKADGAFGMHEIIGSGEDKDETFQVLDSSTSVVIYKPDGAFHIGWIFFSPDGAFMASSNCTGIQVWKLEAGRPVWNLNGFYWPCAFSPDNSALAAYDEAGILYSWRLDTRELISQSHCLSGDRIDVRYQEDHLNDFFHWQCNKDNPLYAKSGLIRMGHEGWVGTRDLRKLLCVPLEYRGHMETGGRTAVITTRDQRLVVICMADDDEQSVNDEIQ